MSDSRPFPPELEFEPVMFARRRRDGWTAERQRAFILALSEIGMVSAAAKAVGMSRKSAYALLERAGPGSSFARAFDAAVEEGQTKVQDETIGRAIHGVEVPVFYRGVQCGTRRVYNDRLLIAAFQAQQRPGRGRRGDEQANGSSDSRP